MQNGKIGVPRNGVPACSSLLLPLFTVLSCVYIVGHIIYCPLLRVYCWTMLYIYNMVLQCTQRTVLYIVLSCVCIVGPCYMSCVYIVGPCYMRSCTLCVL